MRCSQGPALTPAFVHPLPSLGEGREKGLRVEGQSQCITKCRRNSGSACKIPLRLGRSALWLRCAHRHGDLMSQPGDPTTKVPQRPHDTGEATLRLLNTTLRSIGDAVITTDQQGRI